MNDVVVRARVDGALKSETDRILSGLGISTTEAIRMFLAQVRLHRGLPFPVSIPDDSGDLLLPARTRQSALDSVYED